MKIMSSKAVIDVARPIISQNKVEARRRVLRLYKNWRRHADYIFMQFRSPAVPLTPPIIRKKVREEFEKNRHHTDLRVIDLLLFQGQNDLKEVSALWAQEDHVMGKWFKDEVIPRPNSFMGKFLSGSN